MERLTFERALHAWPEWHSSIKQSRKLLGYDPKWPKDTCISWIEEHYVEKIRSRAEEELKKLELPPTLRQYWEDCFYSDYITPDGKTDHGKITRCLSERKSLPDLPCDYGVVWYENEDIHDPWLRVEIKLHAHFANKELFNYAARYAYDTVEHHLRWNNIEPHPLCEWLKGGRPPADKNIAIECARLKDDEGLTYKEIGLHYDWSLQRDSYGNISQCNTARRYVKWGRELKEQYQQ